MLIYWIIAKREAESICPYIMRGVETDAAAIEAIPEIVVAIGYIAVDKAIDFRNKQLKNTNKDLTFVVSGGKGSDEVTSEAEAMKNTKY